MTDFQSLGFLKEYYSGGKLIGSVTLSEKDRDVIGYFGRKSEVIECDTVINKKKIKKGTKVETILYPLCGKVIK